MVQPIIYFLDQEALSFMGEFTFFGVKLHPYRGEISPFMRPNCVHLGRNLALRDVIFQGFFFIICFVCVCVGL